MRILLLNMPSPLQITRRYMCSTLNEMYLFPPHDLMALAGIVTRTGNEVFFIDAIAEKLTREVLLKRIDTIAPALIVTIMSFEWFDKDVDEAQALKARFPEIKLGLFGHYPTHFARETIELTGADFIMLGEPDHVFESLLNTWKGGDLPTHITGTVIKTSAQAIIINEEDRRVPNPNLLPMPPYELLQPGYYREPFMRAPFGMIQSARGCPYKCNYCVHSFGTKLTNLTPENVIEHIIHWQKTHHIKSLRFIDDTFTAVPSRVIKICKLMIEQNIKLEWSCLSRADTLNEEMLYWMKKAGCIRLAIGIETASQRLLDYLDKGTDAKSALQGVMAAKKMGFEIMTFYLVGIPGETEEDVDCSIDFAIKTSHYISVDELLVYPGTPLFDKLGHMVDFNLYPYKNQFRDEKHNKIATLRKRRFFRSFYFTPSYLLRAPIKSLARGFSDNAVQYVLKRSIKK